MLNSRTLDWIIDNQLFSGVPFYSSGSPELHRQMTQEIADGLMVQESDICVVGSGRIGFSLSPLKFGRHFSDNSDLDIVVVSASIFDPSWVDALTRNRPDGVKMDDRTRRVLGRHRDHHYIYNGFMYPDSLHRVLRVGTSWLRTFNGLSQIPRLSGRIVKGRLYRTWDHARIYHQRSLDKVKQKVCT